jgi:DNA-binding helix-hairpin-helix protein with protein kinase domain
VRASVVTSSGVPLRLGRELGKGGEGAVVEVGGLQGRVAKLYHRPPDPRKQAKLRFMAANADRALLAQFAWPQETLHATRGGPAIGFLMPALLGAESIHSVYSPAERRERRPRCGWDRLLCVARNVASAFATLHSRGHVLGDVNQGNVVVARDGRVVLIDCDSFQVNAHGELHPCEVGVSHFTPPELQGVAAFDGVVRTANHDNFGLALLVFHLLFGGRHPYSGVPLRSGVGDALEADIRGFRYAYARDAARRGMRAPPRSLPASLVPPAVERMFHVAFTEVGALGLRPTAAQWVAALDAMRAKLRRCRAASVHVHADHVASCPWCDLERQGVLHFVDVNALQARRPRRCRIERTWALVEAIPAPAAIRLPPIDPRGLSPRPLPGHVPGPQTLMGYRLIAVAIVIALCVFAPQAWVFALIAGVFAWLLAESFFDRPRAAERTRREAELHSAAQAHERLVERVRQEAGPEGFAARKARLAALRADGERLLREESRDVVAARGHPGRQALARARCTSRLRAIEARLQRGAQELSEFGERAAAVARSRAAELEGSARRVAQAHTDLSLV